MNTKFTIILLSLLSLFQLTIAQNKVVTKKSTGSVSTNSASPKSPTKKLKEREYTSLSLKTGVATSVIYLARNIKDYNNEPGFSVGLTYGSNHFLRIATLVTHYKPIDIAPTWSNVRASSYEINLEGLAKFPNKKTLLYPFAGISLNTFQGFFTGQSDYLNLKEYYTPNSNVFNKWVGINLGTGIEHNFGILGLFVDYRMRVGKQEKGINIMDVCYTGGIKINFPKGRLARAIFHTNDRFNWF